jgi:ubiquitin carboxyl-terminal hydrolase 22/27/51
MDSIAVAPKAASLASPKVVKNAKGNIVPSSQMAHIAYGCGMFPDAFGSLYLTGGRAHGRNV